MGLLTSDMVEVAAQKFVLLYKQLFSYNKETKLTKKKTMVDKAKGQACTLGLGSRLEKVKAEIKKYGRHGEAEAIVV